MKKTDSSLANFFASGPSSSLPASTKPNKPLTPDQYTEIKDLLCNLTSNLTSKLDLQTSEIQEMKIQFNLKENSKNSEITALQQKVETLSKVHNITTAPHNHSLSLHSFPTTPDLHMIGCSMHLPDSSPWIDINHETWRYKNSHAESIMTSTGCFSAINNVQQLPCREFKGKTIYPVNLQFNSILQRDLAAKHMFSNAKLARPPAVIQHSLQGFPDLKCSTKWISRILSNKKREGTIANYKINNFATTGPENNFLAPLYSIQLSKGGKWSKSGDCINYTTELINNGLSFDQDEDGKSQTYEQFQTRIDAHIKHLCNSDLDKQHMPKSNWEEPNTDRLPQHIDGIAGNAKRKHSNSGHKQTNKKHQHHSNIQQTSPPPTATATSLPTAPPLQQQQQAPRIAVPTTPIQQQQQVPHLTLTTTMPQQQPIQHVTLSRVQPNLLPTATQPQPLPPSVQMSNYAPQPIHQQLAAPAPQVYMNQHVPTAQLQQHHQPSQQHQHFNTGMIPLASTDNYNDQRNPS